MERNSKARSGIDVDGYELDIPGNSKRRKKRKAFMEVRYERVFPIRPCRIADAQSYPRGRYSIIPCDGPWKTRSGR